MKPNATIAGRIEMLGFAPLPLSSVRGRARAAHAGFSFAYVLFRSGTSPRSASSNFLPPSLPTCRKTKSGYAFAFKLNTTNLLHSSFVFVNREKACVLFLFDDLLHLFLSRFVNDLCVQGFDTGFELG